MGAGRVTGIGGLFWRSADPAALAAWYRQHLGITVTEAGQAAPDGNYVWLQEAGPTVLSVFPAASDYFPPERQVMLNLRVDGLEALTERLQTSGIAVITDEAWNHPDVGRFARIHDPDGNPIELWQPPATP